VICLYQGADMLTCANHDKRVAAGRCAKCDVLFCDTCCAFLINGAAWCEPCGRAEQELGKGNKVLAVVVLVVLLALWAFLVAKAYGMGGPRPRLLIYLIPLVMVPFGAAWAIAYPPTAGERPTLIDRNRRRVALPPLKVDRAESRRAAR
jgi:hypothetical protein